MQKILEHIELIDKLNQHSLDLKFIKDYELKKLSDCCDKLKEKQISKELYKSNISIKRECITDEKFIDYLKEFSCKGISMEKLESLVNIIQLHNKKVSEYNINILISTLQNDRLKYEKAYEYLNYFADKVKDKNMEKIVEDNILYFSMQSDTTINELNEQERSLFLIPVMSSRNLIPIYKIKKVYEFLTQNNELKRIILFLFTNNLEIPLNIDDYELINKNAKDIYYYIKILNNLLCNEDMYRVLLHWSNNKFNIYDLKVLCSKLKMNKCNVNKILTNFSTYINFIYGNKLSKISLEELYGAREKIIVYAISNNKKSFLRLIEENQKVFFDISTNSILFNEDFYSKYININILTKNNLLELSNMNTIKSKFKYYLEPYNYTFEEIRTLYDLDKAYLQAYNQLLDLKVDKRLLIIKQLIKKHLLNRKFENEDMKKLIHMLRIKNLYRWKDEDFSHINNLNEESIIELLIKFDSIKKFISQVNNQVELSYLLRNIEKVQNYDNLMKVKEDIGNIDVYWKKLREDMNLTPEFIKENKNNIQNFLLKNGAELAILYLKDIDEKSKDSFKKIIKAELMGKFKELKYHNGDLIKEIDYDLSAKQIQEWTEKNRSIKKDNIEVKEYDDFYNTMTIGEIPQRTCLSYKNGGYKECLIACFDSNKKILYAKIDGKVVARALVRLTKGKYQNSSVVENKLCFIDLENLREGESKGNNEKEYLTIFLERPYISGISENKFLEIKEMFVELLQQKAKEMNCLLVLNRDYYNISNKDYIQTNYYMYISKSKAGAQYLDSLGGEATVTKEGMYDSNTFIICNLE